MTLGQFWGCGQAFSHFYSLSQTFLQPVLCCFVSVHRYYYLYVMHIMQMDGFTTFRSAIIFPGQSEKIWTPGHTGKIRGNPGRLASMGNERAISVKLGAMLVLWEYNFVKLSICQVFPDTSHVLFIILK